MKIKKVIDASVILTFLIGIDQKIKSQFTKLLKDAAKNKLELYSHWLLPLEVANGLRYSLKEIRLADEILDKFFALPIKYVTLSNVQHRKSLNLAYEIRASAYDASYHVLAMTLGAEYITCDKRYAQSARQLGNILLLNQ